MQIEASLYEVEVEQLPQSAWALLVIGLAPHLISLLGAPVIDWGM